MPDNAVADRLGTIRKKLAAGEIPSRGDCEWMAEHLERVIPIEDAAIAWLGARVGGDNTLTGMTRTVEDLRRALVKNRRPAETILDRLMSRSDELHREFSPRSGDCPRTSDELRFAIRQLIEMRGDQRCCRRIDLLLALVDELVDVSVDASGLTMAGNDIAAVFRKMVFDVVYDVDVVARMAENRRARFDVEKLKHQCEELGIDVRPVLKGGAASE